MGQNVDDTYSRRGGAGSTALLPLPDPLPALLEGHMEWGACHRYAPRQGPHHHLGLVFRLGGHAPQTKVWKAQVERIGATVH